MSVNKNKAVQSSVQHHRMHELKTGFCNLISPEDVIQKLHFGNKLPIAALNSAESALNDNKTNL